MVSCFFPFWQDGEPADRELGDWLSSVEKIARAAECVVSEH